MLDVESELSSLYGSEPLITRGTVHVVHVARGPNGVLHALRVGSLNAPHSPTDFFVLNVCRARADVLLTSAENLRREPTLQHQLQGPWAEALGRYRSHTLGKAGPPVCAILTRSGELPEQHPFWGDGTSKLLLCPSEKQHELALRFQSPLARPGARFDQRAQVIGLPALDARSACSFLHAHGYPLVSVEAGPSTARALYDAPAQVDELLLTHWQDAPVSAELAGPLPPDGALFQGLSLCGSSTRGEAGQRFRFERWRR